MENIFTQPPKSTLLDLCAHAVEHPSLVYCAPFLRSQHCSMLGVDHKLGDAPLECKQLSALLFLELKGEVSCPHACFKSGVMVLDLDAEHYDAP